MIVLLLFTLFGIHGLGVGLFLNIGGMYALDRRLARREMARFDAIGGGWKP